MDHIEIRTARRWLLAGMLLVVWVMGTAWSDALDAPSSPARWIQFAVALAALICLAVVARRMRLRERAAADEAFEKSTTTAD
ncbi:hypothetical protein [Actinomycetospora termitidis]|uniref:Uncharacterized protein n=1 Tax=Actinomycetospora termitidis TaxID=3053470 RepID=A0ABT7M7W4_9PSEU|nr:hypothetical protein [Actinomycetospora sp. Odt1-22]MDL5156773.1 hypothetical protein [Actinomycetospora sp. Odt1-22]